MRSVTSVVRSELVFAISAFLAANHAADPVKDWTYSVLFAISAFLAVTISLRPKNGRHKCLPLYLSNSPHCLECAAITARDNTRC